MKELQPFVNDIIGGTVIELGSRDGHDAKAMSDLVQATRTITIEANPHCHRTIQQQYPDFENYHCAISNTTSPLKFYAVRKSFPAENIGQSSTMYRDIYAHMADVVEVPGYTMDAFVDQHNIDSIDIMKIDVEGATYQVLEGFTQIRMTQLLHIEAEHVEYWPGQKLYPDIVRLMSDIGYEQVYFTYAYDQQSDSIWRRID